MKVSKKKAKKKSNRYCHKDFDEIKEDEMTTIQVSGMVVKWLHNHKVHPRQSYNELILNMIENGASTQPSKFN